MQDLRTSRRTFLKSSAAASVSLALGGQASRVFAADALTVGIIYVGSKDDFGWNASHAVGVAPLARLPGVRIVQQERVPETKEVATAIESMIQQEGAKLILGTSYGYFNPFMVDLAKKYPNVEFRHPTTLWQADKHPKNLGSYFCFLDQAHYIDGIAAGLSTKSNKIGFVCAKPIPLVLRNINSVRVALNKVNPKATLQVIFTGEWTLPVREAEATNALIDAGCDVILTHVDSPRVCIETAERRGAKSCGHNVSQAIVAPKGFITGAENKYETIYKLYAENLKKGEKLPNMLTGGFDKDMVQNTPFGAGATEAARKAVAEATADLKAGKSIFTGTHKDQNGKVVLNKTFGNYDPELDQMNYLLEGVTGALS